MDIIYYFDFFCHIKVTERHFWKMGGSSSSEESNENRMVDSMGQVNNNVIVQAVHDTHATVQLNERMLQVAYTLVAIETIKLLLYLFCAYKKTLKKRYREGRTARDDA